jgi:hypothetical protein
MSQLTDKSTFMRRALPLTLLSSVFVVFSVRAQDRFAYAITDLSKEGAGWNALRRLDLQTGEYSNIILNGIDEKISVYSASSKKKLSLSADARFGTLLHAPFATGVAAAAYDKKHDRLYFTPMFVDQLRYIDLKTMKVFYVDDQPFSKLGDMHNDEGKIVTRMVIAPDGYGYAITNDGHTFIRFSTGKKAAIEHLGSLVDDASNNGVSIHNRCTSFGGDMIADNKGNLYIISARNNVFKVNTETRVATHLGSISGLEPNFTVNGAVVDADGNLLVSSAVDGNSYFLVNPSDWRALPYRPDNGIFKSSDLANGNYLFVPEDDVRDRFEKFDMPKITRPQDKFATQISVYPNPVTTDNITMQFSKIPGGNYTVELRDALGRNVTQRRITINSEMQTHEFRINSKNAKGIYMVKVYDDNDPSDERWPVSRRFFIAGLSKSVSLVWRLN